MGYTVTLRRNADGAIAVAAIDYPWCEAAISYWLDGNMSCDCNRGDFFGDDVDECSDGLYSALFADVPGLGRIPLEADS